MKIALGNDRFAVLSEKFDVNKSTNFNSRRYSVDIYAYIVYGTKRNSMSSEPRRWYLFSRLKKAMAMGLPV
jgi:hypothetical protein